MKEEEKSSIAKARWKLLAQALKKNRKIEQDEQHGSVRNFSGFDIFHQQSLDENDSSKANNGAVEAWKTFKLKSTDDSKEVCVRFLQNVTSAEDLIGFNNTGNVCIWPSEEVLAFYCWKHSEMIRGQNVVELGCGMSGLAGLYLAKNLNVKQMVLTDGNEKSVQNLNAIIKRNDVEHVSSRVLEWKTGFDQATDSDGGIEGSFDVILCADCLFFVELHEALLATIRFLMREKAVCLMMAPRRSGTLDQFVGMAIKSFSVTVEERYDECVWKKHEFHLENTPSYVPDLHYPVLVTLRGIGDIAKGLQIKTTCD